MSLDNRDSTQLTPEDVVWQEAVNAYHYRTDFVVAPCLDEKVKVRPVSEKASAQTSKPFEEYL